MNKQAIAFLSMFTLVFMLAIYYVSLEEESVQVIQPVQSVEDMMEVLIQKNADEKAELIFDLKQQLSQSENQDKNLILNQIEKLNQDETRQDEIMGLLAENGYKSVINISKNTVYVNVFESDDTLEKATTIMTLVYQKMLESETIEVSFS